MAMERRRTGTRGGKGRSENISAMVLGDISFSSGGGWYIQL